MKRPGGFILFVTLLMITIISLLVLTSMQHILLYYKAINKQEELHKNFYQLEDLALQLAHAQKIMGDRNCVVRDDSANRIMHELQHQKGCSLANGSLHYQYFIEDLGEFPCLVIYSEGRKRASYHRRISLLQMDDGLPASFLQIRFFSPGRVKKCNDKEHIVTLGISSWRFLPEI